MGKLAVNSNVGKGSSSTNKVKRDERKVEKIESSPGGGGTILQSPTWDEEGWRNICQKLDDIDEKVIRMTVNQGYNTKETCNRISISLDIVEERINQLAGQVKELEERGLDCQLSQINCHLAKISSNLCKSLHVKTSQATSEEGGKSGWGKTLMWVAYVGSCGLAIAGATCILPNVFHKYPHLKLSTDQIKTIFCN